MEQARTQTFKRENLYFLSTFVLMIGSAVVAPLLGHQALTGVVVNATLFLATGILGLSSGILVSLVPSLIALATGLLPPVLAPMVAFIMAGNVLLVLTFNFFKDRNYWLGMILASVLKFSFLLGTSSIVISLLLKKEIASQVAMIMSWSQLVTALGGGYLAFFLLKKIKKV